MRSVLEVPADGSTPPGGSTSLEELVDLLGQVPDREVAEKVGVSPAAVGRFRRQRGIAPYTGHRFGETDAPATRGRRRSRLEPYRELIGVLPDNQLAAMTGLSSEAVRIYRRRHGIPRPQGGPLPESPGRSNASYRVVLGLDEHERQRQVLHAQDIVSACALAMVMADRASLEVMTVELIDQPG